MHILHDTDPRQKADGVTRFEGQPYGAGVSFFLLNVEPGRGPALHTHPYPETWIIREGRALMTVGDKQVLAGPGDIVVVGPETPHCFRNIGDGQLDIICIHANDRMIQEWVKVAA